MKTINLYNLRPFNILDNLDKLTDEHLVDIGAERSLAMGQQFSTRCCRTDSLDKMTDEHLLAT